MISGHLLKPINCLVVVLVVSSLSVVILIYVPALSHSTIGLLTRNIKHCIVCYSDVVYSEHCSETLRLTATAHGARTL